MTDLLRRKPDGIHARLKAAIEVQTTRCLWTPSDALTFVPPLSDVIYGDGRALFLVGTLNQRPRYWVIRGDSHWTSGMDYGEEPSDDAVDFGDVVEDIITDLEEEFGSARCGYCGQGLSAYSPADPPDCSNENCCAKDDLTAGCGWPSIDDNGGCHWGRADWPKGFETVPHPLSGMTILAEVAP